MERIDCFNYIDYRTMIDHFIKMKQSINPAFSLRAFAKKIGISPGHLSLVINGKKKLSDKYKKLFREEFQLEGKQAEYFDLLVEYGDSESQVKDRLKREVLLLQTQNTTELHEPTRQAQPLAWTWKHHLLMESLEEGLSTEKLIEKYQTIVNLSEEEILDLFNDLVNTGYLQFKDGRYHNLQTDRIWVANANERAKHFTDIHCGIIDKTKQFVQDIGPEDRYSCSEMVVLDESQFEKIKEYTNTFLDEISALKPEENETPLGKKMHVIALHITKL